MERESLAQAIRLWAASQGSGKQTAKPDPKQVTAALVEQVAITCAGLGLQVQRREILLDRVPVFKFSVRSGLITIHCFENDHKIVVNPIDWQSLEGFLAYNLKAISAAVEPEPIAPEPEPIAQPSRPRQAIQRDLFGRITSVRSLTPKPEIAQLVLF